jgi:predicted ATP-grasp superfamily ATP-dependent carboligase
MATAPRNVLITTSRMPFAVDEIHKLGETGNDVTAADTFAASPGGHSRYAARHVEVPAPTQQPDEFVAAVAELLEQHSIDWLLPAFEEVFYLAAHRDRLGDRAELFFPELATLQRVHDKVSFAELCRQLDLPVAETITVTSPDELDDALARWPHWFARAAFGRGGLDLVTNTGPLAEQTSAADIHPTPDNPWLVQEFLRGVDRCSWSVVHHGEVVLHSTYEHPLEIDDRGGIVFESVTPPETLEAAQRIAAELGWHGQISFDYLVTEDGTHHMVECNPRPTAGCTVATAEELDTALFSPEMGTTVVVPAGRKKMIAAAVLRDILRHPSRAHDDLEAAKGAGGVYAQEHDHLPLLYSALSLQHVHQYRKQIGVDRRTHEDLMAAQFFDVQYDGSPIA